MSAPRSAARSTPPAGVEPGRAVALLPLGASPFALCLLEARGEHPTAAAAAEAGPAPADRRIAGLVPGGAVADPLRRAAWEPAGARAYLAEVRSETGVVLSRLVLKLPAGEPTGALYPGEEAPGNLAVEARWEAERRDLVRLLPAAGYCAELVLPVAGGAAPMHLPATLFCEVPGRFFRVPCPCCLGELVTCRDDALLAAAGLPLFSASAVSLLHCPQCAGQGREPRFYLAAEAPPAELAAAGVAGLAVLRAELAATLRDPPGGPAVAAGLPCLTCPEAAGCLGAARQPAAASRPGRGGAAAPAGRWTVFIPGDAPYLVTRVAPVACDAFFDRLGGRDAGAGEPAGTLFAGEGSGIDAVEVLTLKLSAFVQLVRAVRQYTLLLGRPHLDLHTGQVGVEPGLRTGALPDLWNFQVKLTGVSSARPHAIAGAAGGAGVEVLPPPPRPVVPFASPAVQAACLASPSTGEVLIEKAVAEQAAAGLWRIEGKLRDPLGFFPPPAAPDWLQLDWPAALPGASAPSIAARLDPRAGSVDGRGAGGELAFVSEPFALDASTAQRLARGGALRVPGVRYRIFPALGVAEDLYSLGVILMRALLVNDQQGLSDLAPVLQAVPRLDAADRRGARRTVEETLAALLADLPEVLGKANVFYRSIDRQPDRPSAIPYEIWNEVLSLALRLIARGPGFGLDAGETGPSTGAVANEGHAVGPLDFVLAQAEDLVRRLHSLLFERQPMHLEIHSIIAELLAEQESPAGTAPGGRGTDPVKP